MTYKEGLELAKKLRNVEIYNVLTSAWMEPEEAIEFIADDPSTNYIIINNKVICIK